MGVLSDKRIDKLEQTVSYLLDYTDELSKKIKKLEEKNKKIKDALEDIKDDEITLIKEGRDT